MVDESVLDAELKRIVVIRLRVYGAFALVWALGQLALFPLIYPAIGLSLHVTTAVFAVSAAAVVVLARRLPVGPVWLTGLGVGLGLIQLVVHAHSARATGDPIFFYLATLEIVGSGMLVLYFWWSVVFVVAGGAIVLAIGQPAHPVSITVLYCAAVVIHLILHLVGRRYVIGIETLRERDRHRAAALETALAEARTQLADRERAERERAELEERLLQVQKLEALGTLAGGFAHDMNNVLGAILAGGELLREDAPAHLHEAIDDLVSATQRGAELTRNLLGFARRGHYRKEQIDVRMLVAELIRMLERTVPKGVTFASSFEDPCPGVEGDPALLTHALINLCLNSVDAMRGVGTLTIEVRADRAVEPPVTAISVTDTGSGMDPETQRRIFEPFFTTKPVGRGTGLGLAMVYGTVQAWGGTIDVASRIDHGTTMTLRLPLVTATGRQPSSRTRAPTGGMGTVLVVDDDPQLRRGARRILEARGYAVLEAGDGAAALDVYDGRSDTIELVVLDMAMPVMNGAECFRALRARDPALRVILVSGYTLEEDARRCLEDGALGFVDKPYSVERFAAAVGAAMRGEHGAAVA